MQEHRHEHGHGRLFGWKNYRDVSRGPHTGTGVSIECRCNLDMVERGVRTDFARNRGLPVQELIFEHGRLRRTFGRPIAVRWNQLHDCLVAATRLEECEHCNVDGDQNQRDDRFGTRRVMVTQGDHRLKLAGLMSDE